MKLLVDIGNTRIKWAVEVNGVVEKSSAINHQSQYLEQIQQKWSVIESPEILAISSVSNQGIVNQLLILAKKLWPNVSFVIAKSTTQGFDITNGYKQANKLGVDRWMGLIALRHYYPGDSCIIDCGTAITIDVLNKQGLHLGGLISPGLQLMKQSLFQGTENLSYVKQAFSLGLSDATDSAIFSGTSLAAVGLIDKVITEFAKECQTIVLTGGDAVLLSKYLDYQVFIEQDFILKGLALYAKGSV